MSVASRNPFAILEEDQASRPSTPAAPAPKESAPTTAAPTRGGTRGRGGPASRGGRYYQRGGKSSVTREEGGEATADDGAAEGEVRGRGRGRGRGDRARGRGRAFDRHSSTGKTDSEKKVHQGWGGDEATSELQVETAAETDAAVEGAADTGGWGPTPSADAWGAPAEEAAIPASPAEGEKAEGRKPRERQEEEEDNTLTLDQYLKKQTESKLEIVPKLEVRKPNEGDESIWKDAVVVGKKEEEEGAYFVGKSKTAAPKPRAKKEEKVFLEIDARFERPRGGRGRGERGGDRGERRGGRGRGGRGRANGSHAPAAVNVDDETAFPSLS
ncbi:unnamed protein product [Somion occarium]|uniref:Hyaluronan/mRNA-binding protein domain-containing protein n=1 Tax=Somion occarium TaxID=3059160 RepID=A0ABP1CMQ0_9APHY